ncbi:MAG: ribonuclease P protein component [Patescibacteria group bacterium]|nr:ribonuclease P protein component [Patescibacteria group bacterium]
MLAKKYILNNKKIFTALKFKGSRIKIGSFLFSFFVNKSEINNNRFGIIISAKAVARASERNRIKRRIRALLFRFKDQQAQGQFLDLAIIVLNSPKNNDYSKLADFLEQKFN